MKLLLASRNPAKLARMRWLVEGLDVEVIEPAGISEPSAEEGNESVAANAIAKARAWAAGARLPALATDGGLEVPALGSRWNAALTRRAAGAGASDFERAQHLIGLMRNLYGQQREVWWLESAALASPDSRVSSWDARAGPWLVGTDFRAEGVPAGFWVPGVLEYGPSHRRYGELSTAEREAADAHWLDLKRQIQGDLPRLLHAVG